MQEPNEEIAGNEAVKERIQNEVAEFNTLYGNWEQIKKIELLPNELTIEGNELTPTLKLKRKIIMEKYKNTVDKIYKD